MTTWNVGSASIIVIAIISYQMYEKVIIVSEEKTPFLTKAICYVQLLTFTCVASVTIVYLYSAPSITVILSNLAGLMVLTEFNNYIGNFLIIHAHSRIPKAVMSDTFMSDQIS
jgi:hypothetical protein